MNNCPTCLRRLGHPTRGQLLCAKEAKLLVAKERQLRQALQEGMIAVNHGVIYGFDREAFLRAFSLSNNNHRARARELGRSLANRFSVRV